MHFHRLIPFQVSQSLRIDDNVSTQPNSTSSTIGDDVTIKHPKHFRLLLQNPNGFSNENDLFLYQLCFHNIKSISTDIALFPETNLQWTHYTVQTSSNNHRRNTFDFSKQVTSNSNHSYNSTYQPGGICSILIDNMVG